MPNVLLNVSEELLKKIDGRVRSLGAARIAFRHTSEALEHAKKLAKKKGLSAANYYLKSRQPPRMSRVRVMLELIENGLKVVDKK